MCPEAYKAIAILFEQGRSVLSQLRACATGDEAALKACHDLSNVLTIAYAIQDHGFGKELTYEDFVERLVTTIILASTALGRSRSMTRTTPIPPA